MAFARVKISRKQLYERVWATAVTRLAKEYGLSDVGFAKLCKRNEIPLPWRGYWARKAVGQHLTAKSLPKPGEDWEIKITSREQMIADAGLRAEVARTRAKAKVAAPIPIPESLRGAHALVSQALHALDLVEKDHQGILQPPLSGCLDVTVSKRALRRALLLMDGLIGACEARGLVVALVQEEKKSCETVVELMDVQVPFGLRELLDYKDEGKVDADGFHASNPFRDRRNREKILLGRLQLVIDPQRQRYWMWPGLRRTWSDGKRNRLEELLGEFIDGVIQVATVMREAKLAEEEQERKRREEERQAAEREALRAAMWAKVQAEKGRVETLLSDAADWEQSRTLRRYIDAVRQDAVSRGKEVGEGSELGKWFRWAAEQADRLDPLTESPQSIVDDEEKYRPVEKKRFW